MTSTSPTTTNVITLDPWPPLGVRRTLPAVASSVGGRPVRGWTGLQRQPGAPIIWGMADRDLMNGRRAPLDGDAEFVAVVSQIENLVSRGVSSAPIYQAVVDGALRLLGCDCGSLRFLDPEDPTWMLAVAWHGAAGQNERWRHRAPISEGLSGRVISTGAPAVVEGR
jgi:hypothetical protein